ncbi:hypothetical protein N7478_006122 [Penicillium angulare]|uniref:uncharacterized protein n=1 Tax=Penicillium angulare TaxID=116970 RepID=UPI00254047B5|nr:uncharacterized protein N7478_006122 [Penicillium angulare]KAJ5280750.1 hypothetical protein N7478_006122 [Penicillium angulare]
MNQGFEANSTALEMHMNGLKIIINLLGGLDNLDSETQASLYRLILRYLKGLGSKGPPGNRPNNHAYDYEEDAFLPPRILIHQYDVVQFVIPPLKGSNQVPKMDNP